MHTTRKPELMNIVTVFRLAQAVVNRIPEPMGRALFDVVGIAAGLSNTAGVKQLRLNLERVASPQGQVCNGQSSGGDGGSRACPVALVRRRLLSVRAMRSYMRYYYEAFRLPALTWEQIEARVRADGRENLIRTLADGPAAGALMHAGNWDLAGAWATVAAAPVHTIVEKLEPEELFQIFVDFRVNLGMTITPLVKGGGALHTIETAMGEGRVFAPLLADRDLAASGIEVNLAGHAALVAPGPALLAQRTGRPIVPIYVSYERISGERAQRAGSRWGIVLHIETPIWPAVGTDAATADKNADLARMTQEWIDALEPHLRAHLIDWHMLQKVFVADLDPERLARARARAAE